MIVTRLIFLLPIPRPDLLTERNEKVAPYDGCAWSVAWSCVQGFPEPYGFTVILSSLGNDGGGSVLCSHVHAAHVWMLTAVLRKALAAYLADPCSLDARGGRRTAASCDG